MPIGQRMQMSHRGCPINLMGGVATSSPKTDPVRFLRPQAIRCSANEDSCRNPVFFTFFLFVVFTNRRFRALSSFYARWIGSFTHKECFRACCSFPRILAVRRSFLMSVEQDTLFLCPFVFGYSADYRSTGMQ